MAKNEMLRSISFGIYERTVIKRVEPSARKIRLIFLN